MYEGHGDGSGAGQRGFGVLKQSFPLVPKGIRTWENCQPTTPQSRFARQLPFTGEPRESLPLVPKGRWHTRVCRRGSELAVTGAYNPSVALRAPAPLHRGAKRKPPLGAQGEVAHESVPEGIRTGGDRRLTTPQSRCASQLPFTGEPLGRRISCSSNTTSSLFPGQKSFERI